MQTYIKYNTGLKIHIRMCQKLKNLQFAVHWGGGREGSFPERVGHLCTVRLAVQCTVNYKVCCKKYCKVQSTVHCTV